MSVFASARADDSTLNDALTNFCIDCHGGYSRKGDLDLGPLLDGLDDAPLRALRLARDRLRRGDMPPEEEEGQPSAVERASMIAAIEAELLRRTPEVPAGRPTIRRVNRVEYRAMVLDLIGVDVGMESPLPADDVGGGFDHLGDVLSMAPPLLEKYLDIAERVALDAWPDTEAAFAAELDGGKLSLRGGGRVGERSTIVWSSGAAYAEWELPRAGDYRVRFSGYGDQAGDEPVKTAIRDERTRLAYFDLPERRAEPGQRTAVVRLGGGVQRVGIEFLNDFYDEQAPQGARDRNLHVLSLAIEGPLDPVAPTEVVSRLAEPEPNGQRSLEPFVAALAERAFRRPIDQVERDAIVRRVRAALGIEADAAAPWPLLARTAITAVLVDPRFLFHVERDAAPGSGDRALDAHELAARLASFLWRRLPDETLAELARTGRLLEQTVLDAEVDRMLDDPRAIALAEQFGQQWLFIRGLDERQPDPTTFAGVDGALLADLRAETTLFLDAMMRENRPLGELFTADWSYLNQRLAAHYGVAGVDGAWLRRVHFGEARVPGLLGHASVLIATSNPTRTSPVKRGKWVLEALLDAPPPPPPPGVPQLPEGDEHTGGLSVRELLARHRADPACAGCHRQMDALGLALEPLDAVGRLRVRDGNETIDARGDLPDGRSFDGPRELASILAADPGFRRSVVRHLFVYALGRTLSEEDQLVVDAILRGLNTDAGLRDVVLAIVRSEQFRRRSPPPSVSAHVASGRSHFVEVHR
jgi:hypothetical protein